MKFFLLVFTLFAQSLLADNMKELSFLSDRYKVLFMSIKKIFKDGKNTLRPHSNTIIKKFQ